ncbi:hypothetical protein ACLB2K_016062 [Fragaria x ananassa]
MRNFKKELERKFRWVGFCLVDIEFCLDFPDLGKIRRHCLSEGSETVEQIPDLGGNEDVGVLSDEDHEISLDSNEFMQFVKDGDKPLYPGYTKSTKMNVSSKYSCWPVILITYNLPPWLCMKRKYMMLTLLISGPKQPGNDIDVYLQPLVDGLKVLWDGIEQVYDFVRGEYLKLKAQASAFDNTVEKDDAPTPLTGDETFARVQGLPKASGKGNAPAPYKGPPKNRPCWKKKSVFYDLDYWKFFPVRHNLDVMHIEKNCCDAILGTLLNIPGKTKDGVASRLDMVDMGIRTDLKPIAGVKRDKLPLASWNLFVDERKIV